MKNAKRGALRLALYLHCVGINPMPVGQSYRKQFAALLALYESLDTATRKNARRLGRQAMRTLGKEGMLIAAEKFSFIMKHVLRVIYGFAFNVVDRRVRRIMQAVELQASAVYLSTQRQLRLSV